MKNNLKFENNECTMPKVVTIHHACVQPGAAGLEEINIDMTNAGQGPWQQSRSRFRVNKGPIEVMRKFVNLYVRILILGGTTLLTVSCANNEKKTDIVVSPGNISIRSLHFVNEDKIVDIDATNRQPSGKPDERPDQIGGQASISRFALESTVPSPLAIESSKEFDFVTELQSNAVPKLGNNVITSEKTSLNANDVPLNDGIRYRLIFFKDGVTAAIYNELLRTGEAPNLRVETGAKYKWYAISTQDVHTAPNIDALGNIAGADLANRDFMFAAGEMVAQPEENYLDILFLRQMAAIEVTINTRGLFGTIKENSTISLGTGTGNSFRNVIQTGDFNVFKGSFSNLRDVPPIGASSMTIVDSRWGNAEKVAHFYTANTNVLPSNSLRVQLNALHIRLDDENTRSFAANTLVPISHRSTLKLAKGTLSKTNVRLIESGVTVSGLVWARTNLVYDAAKLYARGYVEGNSDAYRFRPDNNYAFPNLNTEYWNFGTTTPKGHDYHTVDPCKRVYPELTWRSPLENSASAEEFSRLGRNANRRTASTAVADGLRQSMIWNGSQRVNPAYPDNNLILSDYGYRDSGGARQQRLTATFSNGGSFRYKSGTYDRASSGARILYAEINRGKIEDFSIQQVNFSQGNTIRCVRNIINN
ncbi:hypothetical protein [Sphingobacterium sp.]|uniref:hypothetical protein n=1 Tax=Sphingobacterium sp. TaxID=341027 RepID=UPI0031E43907